MVNKPNRLIEGGTRPPGAAEPAEAEVFGFAGERTSASRAIAVEWPVQVSYGDVPFGVMMLTPQDLEDFAYGFSLTEGVIDRAGDIRDLAVRSGEDGIRLRIDLSGMKLHAHLARRRSLAGRTGCGLCGIEDLSALARASVEARPAGHITLGAIEGALTEFDRHQALNAQTRAVHGAAWCSPEGVVLLVREDVGRHNALDKLIGALLRAGIAADTGFVLITSRASYEMVEKVATFGARTMVAISAPTSLAIHRAQALDLTLVGIARRDGVTVFHGAERVTADRPAATSRRMPDVSSQGGSK